MSTLESIISLLELFAGLFLYFGLPALIFVITFAAAVILVTRIGSSLLTTVLPRVPTVARPINKLTKTVRKASGIGSFERTRHIVIGSLSFAYAVVYLIAAIGILAGFEMVGRAVFTNRPEWYLMLSMLSYPIIALLFVLPLILVIYTLRGSWRGSTSLSRTVFEWGVILLLLNILVPIGLYAAVFGSTALGTWLFEALWWVIEAVSRSVPTAEAGRLGMEYGRRR